MLKTTMSLQILVANELLGSKVLVANEAGDDEGGEIEMCKAKNWKIRK